jgi:hypothetical protein
MRFTVIACQTNDLQPRSLKIPASIASACSLRFQSLRVSGFTITKASARRTTRSVASCWVMPCFQPFSNTAIAARDPEPMVT